MVSNKVILILGAGPRVGQQVAKKFAAQGYKVALTSRKGTRGTSPEGYLSIPGDLSDPKIVPGIFEQVTKEFGAPSTIVYNAAYVKPVPADDSLSLPVAAVEEALAVLTLSAYVAAQESLKGFKALDAETPKSFIFTGNILNLSAMPSLLSLGIGKAASAHFIDAASKSYSERGYHYYYADQRTPEGRPMMGGVDGEAHADFFWELAEGRTQRYPWEATFVKGKGYVKF